MGKIVSAKAYANNEVAFMAWTLDDPIEDCLGFEVTRIYLDTNEEVVLPAWVPFKGQSNPDWKPQTTSVWPVQKLVWRDLTARKRRDRSDRRPADARVKYRVRAVVPQRPGLTPVTNLPAETYEGAPLPLAYADGGMETNEVTITARHGSVQATFTNGILSGQWLRHALEEMGQKLTPDVVRGHISAGGDKFRRYLTGDVLGTLRQLLERAAQEPGAKVRLALYELSDTELTDLIIANKDRVRVILSNSSKDRTAGIWDLTNRTSRRRLKATAGLEVHDRLFDNGHIGHNKFAVLVRSEGTPQAAPVAVMTGSTNWTATGLCGQSNNALIVESPALARQYADYWDRLLADTRTFQRPASLTVTTANVQGPAIRAANAKQQADVVLKDGTTITLWCAPNTKARSKGHDVPPDLAAVYSWMRRARRAILFAVFLPARAGKLSIVEEAIALGLKDPSLIVYGTVSDPTAMPNYVAPPKKSGADDTGDDDTDAGNGHGAADAKKPSPAVYDNGRVHIVRAAALTKDDIVGQFEQELLKVGNAIIHDKIVVVDPTSEDGLVVMGSHNMGYKASYENDENLLIIRRNPSLVQAYATHVLDLWEHYRFRAVQLELAHEGKKQWDGFLSRDGKWLEAQMKTSKGDLARYFGD